MRDPKASKKQMAKKKTKPKTPTKSYVQTQCKSAASIIPVNLTCDFQTSSVSGTTSLGTFLVQNTIFNEEKMCYTGIARIAHLVVHFQGFTCFLFLYSLDSSF